LFREEKYEDYEGRHAGLVDASETLDQIDDPRVVLREDGSSIEASQMYGHGQKHRWRSGGKA